MSKEKRVGRVSKDQWLATALEELEKGGIEAVRVQLLAKICPYRRAASIGISKIEEICTGIFWTTAFTNILKW